MAYITVMEGEVEQGVDFLLGSIRGSKQDNAPDQLSFSRNFASATGLPTPSTVVRVYLDDDTLLFAGTVDEITNETQSIGDSNLLIGHRCIGFNDRLYRRLTINGTTGAIPTYRSYASTVDTLGTAVTWKGDDTFEPDLAGKSITIGGSPYTVSSVTDPKHLVLGSSAGTQTDVALVFNLYTRDVAKDLIDNYLDNEGFTYSNDTLDQGAVIRSKTFAAIPVASALGELLELNTDFASWVTPAQVIHLQARTAVAAPFAFTDITKRHRNGISVSRTREDVRNCEVSQIKWESLVTTVKTITGDGVTRSWFTTTPIGSLVGIRLNSVMVGASPESTASADYFYRQDGKAVWQDPSLPVLQDTDTLEIEYYPLGANYQYYLDEDSATARAAIEGGSGKYEVGIDRTASAGQVEALTEAQGNISRYKDDVEKVRYSTLEPGMFPGMVLTFSSSKHGVDGSFYLDKVDFTDKGVEKTVHELVYTLEAVSASRRDKVDIFRELVGKPSNNSGSGTVNSSTPLPLVAPPHVILGTPIQEATGTGVRLRLPITYPDPLGTLKKLNVRLEDPYTGTPGDTATNVPPEHTVTILKDFKLDPEIVFEVARGARDLGIWVTSSSDTIDRKYTEAGTPKAIVTISDAETLIPGAEYGPNPEWIRVIVERQTVAGAMQMRRPIVIWPIPADDPRYPLVREWEVCRMDPSLSDNPATTEDERILSRTRVPADKAAAAMDWFYVHGNRRYIIMVRPVTERGINTYVPGVTCAIPVWIGLLAAEPGAEYADPVSEFGWTYTYGKDPETGQPALIIDAAWTNPSDVRYGGVVLTIQRAGDIERDITGVETGESMRLYIAQLPSASESVTLRAYSVDANNYRNNYWSGTTPEVTATIEPRTAAQRILDVTGFSVAHQYVTDPTSGQKYLEFAGNFTVPVDAAFAGIDFWAKGPDGWRYYSNIRRPGDVDYLDVLPDAQFAWEFLAVANDVNGKDRDGAIDTDPDNPPAGTPSYTHTIDPPTVDAPLGNATGFSVASEYRSGDYYGIQSLVLVPTFTPPADASVAYFEFWAYREDSKWYLLGNPAESGENGKAWLRELPTTDGDWNFALISKDVNGKDRDGNINSDPAAPPTGTATCTLHVDPPTEGTFDPGKLDRTKLPEEWVIDGADLKVAFAVVEKLWGVKIRVGGAAAVAITGATNASPCVIQKNGHGLTGDVVLNFAGFTGSWATINGPALVRVTDGDHFAVPLYDTTTWGAVSGTPTYALARPGLIELLDATGALVGQLGKCEDPENPGSYYYGVDFTDGAVVVRANSANRKVVLSDGRVYVLRLDDQANTYSFLNEDGLEVHFRRPDGEGGYIDCAAQIIPDVVTGKAAIILADGGVEVARLREVGTGAEQVAAGDHAHDAAYENTELAAYSTPNNLILTNSYQDVNGCSVTLDKDGVWLLIANVCSFHQSGDGDTTVQLVCGAAVQAGVARANLASGTDVVTATVSQTWVYTASGSTVAKLQAKKASGAGASSVSATDTTLTAVWLHA